MRPDLRIFLIDPHNEYGHCFRDRAQVLNPKNLKLPFWLFNFEETVDVFFRGRPGPRGGGRNPLPGHPAGQEHVSPTRAAATRIARCARSIRAPPAFTVDTPVPYRLSDSSASSTSAWASWRTARRRPYRPARRAHRDGAQGPALRFHVRQRQCRRRHHGRGARPAVPAAANGKPMTVMQLAGFPAEVVEFGRLRARPHGLRVRAVERRRRARSCSRARRPTAMRRRPDHRLRAHAQGHLPHRQGRQEIPRVPRARDPAAGRTRFHDHLPVQHHLRHADGKRARPEHHPLGRLGRRRRPARFVPSLGTREVFAFGEGVALPTRLRFSELAAEHIPRSESVSSGKIDTASVDATLIERVIERWRGATMGNKHRLGMTTQDHGTPTPEIGGPTPLEAERSLLRAAAPSIASGKEPPATPARRDSDLRSRLLRK